MVTMQPSSAFNVQPSVLFSAKAKPQPIAPSADQVQFAGKRAGRGKGIAARLALMAATLPMLGVLGATAAVADSGSTVVSNGQVSVDEQKQPFVDKASDLPDLNSNLKDPVVDLVRNPLLSKSTQHDLERFLNQFNQGDDGQAAVVVIPDTHQDQLARLATDLGNQIGIGDDKLDNGLLMLINAQAVRENRDSGRMFIATGSGINEIMSDRVVTSLLVDHALPHLKTGNYDQAVEETMKAATEMLENPELAQESSFWGSRSQTEKVILITLAVLVLLLIIGAMAAAGTGGGGGYYGGGYSSGSGGFSGGFSSSGGGGFGGGGFGGGGGGI